eukprot:CAMPEP_0174852014 /NCGR_PEP_ID=MMETSP1114-20130205/24967_1 /TAXON_ID=312471 /ORGANISM="Neobodo designis, Strain CCAP 1951/1" /LENGTH=54 /DNA_ID=CAMNT_0016086587 /DNA_START=40 /DNA_END=200 /DNA_ORIENTATION=-
MRSREPVVQRPCWRVLPAAVRSMMACWIAVEQESSGVDKPRIPQQLRRRRALPG